MFHLYNEVYGYCLSYSPEERLKVFENQKGLLDLIFRDGDYGKNCMNRLYASGHIGHLYHQTGNDRKALEYLRKAAEYAKELDSIPDISQKAMRFYNAGLIYRETNASQFMKTVITEHYPLSDEFKALPEFKEIIKILEENK